MVQVKRQTLFPFDAKLLLFKTLFSACVGRFLQHALRLARKALRLLDAEGNARSGPCPIPAFSRWRKQNVAVLQFLVHRPIARSQFSGGPVSLQRKGGPE